MRREYGEIAERIFSLFVDLSLFFAARSVTAGIISFSFQGENREIENGF